jgi:hypothetical protein
MSNSPATVEGIDEVIAMLDQAPRVIVAGAFLKALQAAARVMSIELAIRTPSDPNHTEITDKLNESQVTEIILDSQLRGGTVDIGFGKNGHIALWVEFGHRMVGHKPGKKLLGQVAAMPFMRPALDASYEKAVEAFATSMDESMRTNIKIGVTNG